MFGNACRHRRSHITTKNDAINYLDCSTLKMTHYHWLILLGDIIAK